jgi:RimJ/RimL family protein N-acetyltransferase
VPARATRGTLLSVAALRPTSDGLVTIRPPAPGDAAVLVAGRDEQSRRFLGEGDDEPDPTACVVVRDEIVGWVDFDVDRAWLAPGEVNVGYGVFAAHRGNGYATRAVKLLLHHLAVATAHHTATLLISAENGRSLALARRAGFTSRGDLDGHPYFARPVPPLDDADDVVTIRPRRAEDRDREAMDDGQVDRLRLPGGRAAEEAMTTAGRRAHAGRDLSADVEGFGTGPTWTFTVDHADAVAVARVDCDLAGADVPPGEARISYACHPGDGGRDHVRRAVHLVLDLLADHTAAREAHLLVDAGDAPSRRVAEAVGAHPVEEWDDAAGRRIVRHVRAL